MANTPDTPGTPDGAPTPGPQPASATPLSGEAEKPRPVDPALEPETPGLLSDCRLMLSYSRKNAFVLAPELMREIAWLDAFLKSRGISPISSIASRLVSTIEATSAEPRYVGAATPPAGISAEEAILDVHAQLSTLISPTTALSLQTSEPPSGKAHILGGMPPLVRTVIAIAVGSALVFVATALGIARNAAKTAAVEKAKVAITAPGAPAPAPAPGASSSKGQP